MCCFKLKYKYQKLANKYKNTGGNEMDLNVSLMLQATLAILIAIGFVLFILSWAIREGERVCENDIRLSNQLMALGICLMAGPVILGAGLSA